MTRFASGFPIRSPKAATDRFRGARAQMLPTTSAARHQDPRNAGAGREPNEYFISSAFRALRFAGALGNSVTGVFCRDPGQQL